MAWLKGQEIGGYVNIDKRVKFNDSVIADALNQNPWSDVYYVDNDNGTDGALYGTSPTRAFKTLTYAVTQVGSDDVIYVRAKGAETDASDYSYITEGAQVTVPYASVNLSIIGVTRHFRNPYMGVWFQHGATDGDTGYVLLNYAPGLSLYNLGFSAKDYIRSSYGAVSMYGGPYTTYAGSVGFSVYNCFFRDGQLNVWGGYDSCTSNCTFKASGSANSGWWSTSNTYPTGGHQVINSHFGEMFADNQALRYIYCVAGAQKDMLFQNLTMGLVPADNHYMWFGGSNTGLVCDIRLQSADVTYGTDDTDDELYSADGGVQFLLKTIEDASGANPGT